MKVVTKEEFERNLKSCQRGFISLEVEQKVAQILSDVRQNGDEALMRYEAQFDRARLTVNTLEVSKKEITEALKVVPQKLLDAISVMIQNVRRYQKDLLYKDWIKTYGKVRLGSLVRALERAGVYVPGGTAPLVSTVVMTVIPAKVAGVEEVIVTTPPNQEGKINPAILAACHLSGTQRIFKLGGAQAIAAMAFGTATVPKADKIVGPGNIYVASAKRQVYGFVGIDMVAGPSEVLIIADDTANAKFVAADLLAQAEHDVMARAFLVTSCESLIHETQMEIAKQLQNLGRKNIAQTSIENQGVMVLVKSLEEAAELSNEIAPEHLEILCRNPMKVVKMIKSAGAIFVGDSTPEPVGDYVAGPSHVLPTGGTARFFSPLSARDFLKSMSFLQYDRASLSKDLKVIQEVAQVEGLDAHRKSAEARFQ